MIRHIMNVNGENIDNYIGFAKDHTFRTTTIKGGISYVVLIIK